MVKGRAKRDNRKYSNPLLVLLGSQTNPLLAKRGVYILNISSEASFNKGRRGVRYVLHYFVKPNAELKQRARDLRNKSTLSEILLWNQIKNRRLNGFRFYRQRTFGWYIVDFYCAQASLVVEIDGDSHDLKQEYDAKRDEYLQSQGFTVLRFNDLEVKHNIDAVVCEIVKILKDRTPRQS
jgi:very-short-patch-repair endonuclease